MTETLAILIEFLIRVSLIALFLPFSAFDKIVNRAEAIKQARQIGIGPVLAGAMIAIGISIEVICSIGIVTGIADRLAAFIFAGYCATTAVIYKRFWATSDFALVGPSKGREVFWDFMKNFAVAGGFLLITFGTSAATVDHFFADPLSSSYPYQFSHACHACPPHHSHSSHRYHTTFQKKEIDHGPIAHYRLRASVCRPRWHQSSADMPIDRV